MDEKRNYKRLVIGSLITFGISIFVAGIIFALAALNFQNQGLDWKEETNLLHGLVDATSIAGLFGILAWAMMLLSDKGAFDILAYSLKLVWYNTFKKSIRETALPKTYAEYVELKRGDRGKSYLYILLGSLPSLIIGIILIIPFNLSIK